MLSQLSQIESIKKTTPNLSRVLDQICGHISGQYKEEKQQLLKLIAARDWEIGDARSLLKQSEDEKAKMQERLNKIEDFIYGSQYVTLLKGKESENFLAINYEEAEEELALATNNTKRLNYSNLKERLDEVDEKIAHD